METTRGDLDRAQQNFDALDLAVRARPRSDADLAARVERETVPQLRGRSLEEDEVLRTGLLGDVLRELPEAQRRDAYDGESLAIPAVGRTMGIALTEDSSPGRESREPSQADTMDLLRAREARLLVDLGVDYRTSDRVVQLAFPAPRQAPRQVPPPRIRWSLLLVQPDYAVVAARLTLLASEDPPGDGWRGRLRAALRAARVLAALDFMFSADGLGAREPLVVASQLYSAVRQTVSQDPELPEDDAVAAGIQVAAEAVGALTGWAGS